MKMHTRAEAIARLAVLAAMAALASCVRAGRDGPPAAEPRDIGPGLWRQFEPLAGGEDQDPMLERVKRLAARERARGAGRPLVVGPDARPDARPEAQPGVPAGVPEEAPSAIQPTVDGEERHPVKGAAAPQASPGPFWLGAGDEVDIVVGGQPEFSGVVAVRDDGKIALPTTGDLVEATGLSPNEFAVGVAAALHPRYLKRKPEVSVELRKSPRLVYYVFGAVRRPGTHAMPPAGITVLDAVLAASSGQRRRPDRAASSGQRRRPDRAGPSEASGTFEPVRGARYGRVHVVPPDGAPVRIVDITSAMQGGPGLREQLVPGSRVIVPERSGRFSEAELKRRLYPDGLVTEGGAR